MNMLNREILKKTWLYKHFRNFLLWPKDLAYKLPLKRKFFLMMYHKNWMIDPCTSKRQKYWKKCGVNALGNFNVGADVYFDAQNAHYLTIEDGAWISSRCLILMNNRDIKAEDVINTDNEYNSFEEEYFAMTDEEYQNNIDENTLQDFLDYDGK